MLQGEHAAILSIFIKLPFVIKFFVLSIFVWWLKTGFTVLGCLKTSLPVQNGVNSLDPVKLIHTSI